MGDIMRPMPFGHLMDWILSEYRKNGEIFGISKLVKHENGQALPIFGEKIEFPFDPAAGPNTQLAQNIIASYAAGARFFELKNSKWRPELVFYTDGTEDQFYKVIDKIEEENKNYIVSLFKSETDFIIG